MYENADNLILGIPNDKKVALIKRALRRKEYGVVATFVNIIANHPEGLTLDELEDIVNKYKKAA